MIILDIEESGKKLGEKLFSLLTKTQGEELMQFVLDNRNRYTGFCEDKNSCIYFDSIECMNSLTEINAGELYLCVEQRIVQVRGKEIYLTVKEFDILLLMITHPKRVFTYEMIMDFVWHEDYTFYSRKAVNNHVSNLRRKLKIAPDIPDYIKSVYGVGYKFET